MNKIFTSLAIILFLLLIYVVVGTKQLDPIPASLVTKIGPTELIHTDILLPPTQEFEPTAAEPIHRFQTPSRIYGVYSTSWVAGSKRVDSIIDFIKQTKINTLVIDVKDDTGIISFPSDNSLAREIGANSNRIPDLKELLARLNQEKIYTIGRIVVFKDPLLARQKPEIAV